MNSPCAWLVQHVGPYLWVGLVEATLTILLFYPICVFLSYGWAQRSNEILSSLGRKAKRRYLATFQKGDPHNTRTMSLDAAVTAFRVFYNAEYGRHRYFIPIALFAAVALFGNYYLAKALLALTDKSDEVVKLGDAALAGAYTFVCWDMFARMQQKTLSRAMILRSALRLALAVPIGLAFAKLSSETPALVAFGVGAFPMQGLAALVQRLVKKFFPAESKSNEARDQVFKLTGIDTTIAERIEDADITTITQLAWADPVQLTMRTNLQFAFVLDIISQALAWAYLEDKLSALGKVGLRGAVEIRQALGTLGLVDTSDDQEDGDNDEKREAEDGLEPPREPSRGRVVIREHGVTDGESTVIERRTEYIAPDPPPEPSESPEEKAIRAAIAQAASIVDVEDEDALTYALMQIADDPSAQFLATAWHSLTKEQGTLV